VAVNKIVGSAEAALEGVQDGAVVMVGGFGMAGAPTALLTALAGMGLRGLTIVTNNAGASGDGIEQLLSSGAVGKLICSYPKAPGSVVFEEVYRRGEVELELTPQGTLSERIRAAGAGIGGFYVRTAVDTELAEGKEHRVIDGVPHVLELPLRADLALIRAERADRWGNLTYNKAARNFGPTMAAAATRTVAEARAIVELGELDPETIVTPGIYVTSVVEVPA
jgi:3-oxoadipate CoA-transferase alpha subunit